MILILGLTRSLRLIGWRALMTIANGQVQSVDLECSPWSKRCESGGLNPRGLTFLPFDKALDFKFEYASLSEYDKGFGNSALLSR